MTPGTWAFGVQIELLSETGVCVGAYDPAGTFDIVGPAGGASYQYTDPAHGIILTVYWTGANWRLQFQQSGFQDWYVIDEALLWDAVLKEWTVDASRAGGPGFGCTQDLRFHWRPFARMGEQVVRNRIDELTPARDRVWRWNLEDVQLPGHRTRTCHNGGRLWLPAHERGLTRKWGSQTVPFVDDVFVWWEP